VTIGEVEGIIVTVVLDVPRSGAAHHQRVASFEGRKTDISMTIVRKSKSQIGKGSIDRARVRRASEDEIAAWKREEGVDDALLGPVRYVPNVDVRKVRERLGLSQEEFAHRYRLSLRTIQEWEQGRKQPSEAARVLLFAIARDPKALGRALRT
jgi:putative transcriptional regulator